MDIKEHILFITGKLAEKNLKKILDCIEDKKFSYEIKFKLINKKINIIFNIKLSNLSSNPP